jgi:hypothetical protein
MQLMQADSPCPDVPTQAANALTAFSHSDDAAASAGATAGGNVPEARVGGGTTGLDGYDGIGAEYGQPKKQSEPQWHVSYASMNGPQVLLAQLNEHNSIQSQMAAADAGDFDGHPPKQSDPQVHVCHRSMPGLQGPHRLAHPPTVAQMADVIWGHVVALLEDVSTPFTPSVQVRAVVAEAARVGVEIRCWRRTSSTH